MLWRLPNKEIKSYNGKTKIDKGLKLSDNVKLVYLFGNKLETRNFDLRGGKMAPFILRPITAKFWTKSAVFHGTNHWSIVFVK